MRTNTSYLEHANISVNNLDETVEFIQTALPEFKVRGGGESNGRKWIHIGTDESYLALTEVRKKENGKNYHLNGLNHLGFVVDDVTQVAERLSKKGYVRSYPLTKHQFRIRDYFLDNAGNEYEFVQYLSDNPKDRNTYLD